MNIVKKQAEIKYLTYDLLFKKNISMRRVPMPIKLMNQMTRKSSIPHELRSTKNQVVQRNDLCKVEFQVRR